LSGRREAPWLLGGTSEYPGALHLSGRIHRSQAIYCALGEFTTPVDLKKKRKDKWLFSNAGEHWFCVAGLWRALENGREAFTMLTAEPGPDVAPYHARQIVVLERSAWSAWLDPTVPARGLLGPAAAGSLLVEQVG
jgi:putative SOS response-associated peptidase YedK